MAIVKKFRIISYKKRELFLSLENISFSFNKNHQILDNISLDIPRGQILGLLGPNGTGKSTLMNIITGHLKPNYGKIKIKGNDVTNLPIYLRTRKFKISIIPQFGGIFYSMTTEQNLKVVAEILIKDKSLINIRINELISKFELDSVKKLKQNIFLVVKKRLVIAMGLISNPEIILMDEPLAALDPQTIQMLQNTIAKLQTDLNLTIIITDHQARDLLAICDKAIIISNSKIIASGTPNELVNDVNANKFILEKISNLDNSNNEKFIAINSKIKNYYKIINVDGDKSISIRSLIFASMANGKSKIQNLLESEDVLNTINCLKILGVKIKKRIDRIKLMD